MPRLIQIVVAVLIVLAPQAALAWSERPAPTNQDGSSKFSDPDERVERMTGRSDSGDQSRTSAFGRQDGGSGWSFSAGPRPSGSPSPFSSMFDQNWPDRRR